MKFIIDHRELHTNDIIIYYNYSSNNKSCLVYKGILLITKMNLFDKYANLSVKVLSELAKNMDKIKYFTFCLSFYDSRHSIYLIDKKDDLIII